MWLNPQETADLFTFAKKIINRKFQLMQKRTYQTETIK